MLDLFHLVTTGNFQIEKQNKMSRWSGLYIIKLLPGGATSAQLMLRGNAETLRSEVKCLPGVSLGTAV